MSNPSTPRPGRGRSLAPVFLLLVFGTFVALVTEACGAGARKEAESTPHPIRIQVQNNLDPPAPARIYIEPRAGARDSVGVAEAQETTTLDARPEGSDGRRRLVAVVPGAEIPGGEIVSDFFLPTGVQSLSWNLAANELEERGE